MKLDYDLFRAILLRWEEAPAGEAPAEAAHDGHSKIEVMEHEHLLIREGYLEGESTSDVEGNLCLVVTVRLTMKGHQFLREAKNSAVWRKVIAELKKKGISVSLAVLSELLKKAAFKMVGL